MSAAPGLRPGSEAAGRGSWLAFAVRAFRRVPPRLASFQAAEIMAARTSELRLLPRAPKAVAVRVAGPSDAAELDRFSAHSGKAPRRLSAGDTCLMAMSGEDILAVEWIRWGPAEYEEDERTLGVRFRVPARAGWLHNGRNRARDRVGPWGLVMGRLRPVLEERGVETVYLQVAADNLYSIACHESLGFRRLGRLLVLRSLRTPLVAFWGRGAARGRVAASELDLSSLPV